MKQLLTVVAIVVALSCLADSVDARKLQSRPDNLPPTAEDNDARPDNLPPSQSEEEEERPDFLPPPEEDDATRPDNLPPSAIEEDISTDFEPPEDPTGPPPEDPTGPENLDFLDTMIDET